MVEGRLSSPAPSLDLQPWAPAPFLCLLQRLPSALLLTGHTGLGGIGNYSNDAPTPAKDNQPPPRPEKPKPIFDDPNFVANSNSQLQTTEHHLKPH